MAFGDGGEAVGVECFEGGAVPAAVAVEIAGALAGPGFATGAVAGAGMGFALAIVSMSPG